MRINENSFSASVTAKHLSEAETCTRALPWSRPRQGPWVKSTAVTRFVHLSLPLSYSARISISTSTNKEIMFGF